MPPLEAMACGTPVVATTSSSLPEVVGDAGLLMPPTDADALGAALLRLLDDAELREELRARGLRQARRFSWRETAERTLLAYQEAQGERAAHVDTSAGGGIMRSFDTSMRAIAVPT